MSSRLNLLAGGNVSGFPPAKKIHPILMDCPPFDADKMFCLVAKYPLFLGRMAWQVGRVSGYL